MLNRLFVSSRRVLSRFHAFLMKHVPGIVLNIVLGGVIAAALTFTKSDPSPTRTARSSKKSSFHRTW